MNRSNYISIINRVKSIYEYIEFYLNKQISEYNKTNFIDYNDNYKIKIENFNTFPNINELCNSKQNWIYLEKFVRLLV